LRKLFLHIEVDRCAANRDSRDRDGRFAAGNRASALRFDEVIWIFPLMVVRLATNDVHRNGSAFGGHWL
jgi:hypothetical protein